MLLLHRRRSRRAERIRPRIELWEINSFLVLRMAKETFNNGFYGGWSIQLGIGSVGCLGRARVSHDALERCAHGGRPGLTACRRGVGSTLSHLLVSALRL